MSEATTSPEQIEKLKKHAAEHPQFVELLEESLKAAKKQAKKDLKHDLYEALDWPTDFDAYVVYLEGFARWTPQQSDADAWKAAPPDDFEHQEVYDRLCHFYYLVDQPVGKDGKVIVENLPWFSKWLVAYADLWGSFLDTTDSFSDEILETFIRYSPEYEVEDSMIDGRPNAPSGWLTFNQFFARELNPGLRPIAHPSDNGIIVAPADCTYKAQYDIAADSSIPEITVKKTHKFANVEQLLEGSPYKSDFAGGKFVHYFLGPYSYHRFHTPVAGLLCECRAVRGLVYLEVNLDDETGQFDAPDASEGGYEFYQARGIVIVDTSGSPYGDIGLVGVVPVGMCQVSSVNMTAQVGKEMLKGDEFGYFLFGGSDIIVLLQEDADPRILDTGSNYLHYGDPIATCTEKGF